MLRWQQVVSLVLLVVTSSCNGTVTQATGCQRHCSPASESSELSCELRCTGVLQHSVVEAELAQSADYAALRLHDCSLDVLPDLPPQGKAGVNLELLELRRCSAGQWRLNFTNYPERLQLQELQVQDTGLWQAWHREMLFAGTVPFSYSASNCSALLRLVDCLFPKLSLQSPPGLRVDWSHNDLSHWLHPQADLLTLFAAFHSAASNTSVTVIDQLVLTDANFSSVPRLPVTVRNLLNLSSNLIEDVSLDDLTSFTFLPGCILDLSNNPIPTEALLSFKQQFAQKLTEVTLIIASSNSVSSTQPPPPQVTSAKVTVAGSTKHALLTKNSTNVPWAETVSRGTVTTASATVTVAVVALAVVMFSLVVLALVLRHRLPWRSKAKQRRNSKAPEIDTARWDPELGIVIGSPAQTLLGNELAATETNVRDDMAMKNVTNKPEACSAACHSARTGANGYVELD